MKKFHSIGIILSSSSCDYKFLQKSYKIFVTKEAFYGIIENRKLFMKGDYMSQTKDYISDILKYISTFAFLYVAIMAVVYIKREICGVPTAIIFIASAVIVLAGALGSVLLSNEKNIQIIQQKSEKYRKRENLYLLMATLILFGIQCIVVWNVVFRTSWDPGAVWYGAHYVSLGDRAGMESMAYYFSVHPNNLVLVFVYSVILKLNMLTGSPISNGTMLLALFQCFLISVSGVLFFKTAKRVVGSKLAWLGYFLYFILVGLSGWILIPYSDSTGLIFPILLFYIYTSLKGTENIKKKYFSVFLLVFLGYIGFQIKPMAVIVLIAIIVIEGLNFIGQSIRRKRVDIREAMKYITSGVLGMGIAFILVSAAIKTMDFPVVTETVLGWQHHMMLGLNKDTNGGYSQADFDYSTSFATSEEQHEAEYIEIKERLKDFGVIGYLEHFVKKSSRNFFDASFGWGGIGENFYSEIFPERDNKLCSVLRSLYYDNTDETLYKYHWFFRQTLWYVVVFSMTFMSWNKDVLDDKRKVLTLSILGLMLYLQIFEAHPRYMFTFVPLYIIAAGSGVRNIICKMKSRSIR